MLRCRLFGHKFVKKVVEFGGPRDYTTLARNKYVYKIRQTYCVRCGALR